MGNMPEAVIAALIISLGAAFGSFANLVIARLPRGESIVTPRSYCENCKTPLKIPDLVPILSFLFLRGRCRYCSARLSVAEPIIEFLTALLAALAWAKWSLTPEFFIDTLLVVVLLIISMIDLKEGVIFDVTLWAAGILAVAWLPLQEVPIQYLLGGGIAAGTFWFIRMLGTWIWKREAMGWGDVKLALVLGLFVGMEKLHYLILGAFVLALIVSLPLLLTGRKKLADEIPFGPFLCAAAIIVLMLY